MPAYNDVAIPPARDKDLPAAGALLYIVPVLLIFLFAQRDFICCPVSSGVKG